MHSHKVLKSIYQEHGGQVSRMIETLADLDISPEDVALLSRMPWRFPANRIAVERERLGLPPVHPLLHWKPPPAPPKWLTPAIMLKMFELALSDEHAKDAGPTLADQSDLILPA